MFLFKKSFFVFFTLIIIACGGTKDDELNIDDDLNIDESKKIQQTLVGSNYSYDFNIGNIFALNYYGIPVDSLNFGNGFNSEVKSMALQPDGKILVGGGFTSYNGTGRNRIARLHSDGSLDGSFNVGTGAASTVNKVVLQEDGKIILGGSFTGYNNQNRNRIARLHSDGSLDGSFNVGTGFNDSVLCITLQTNGKIIVGGYFTKYNGLNVNKIVRLNFDGSIDTSFNLALNPGYVSDIGLQPDGKIIIGGGYNGVGRLNFDGSIDTSFYTGNGFNGYVNSITLQSDGKIIVGGSFTSYNGTDTNNIARFNNDGSLDTNFNIGLGFNNAVISLSIQTDGKIIVGGYFTSYNGLNVNKIVKINSDGSIDFTFVSNLIVHFYSHISTMLLSNEVILVGGLLSNYKIEFGFNQILNNDGSIKSNFNLGTLYGSGTIFSVSKQKDNKLIIAGEFTSYNSYYSNNIIRITENGNIDEIFNTGMGSNGIIYTTAIQTDGKILIGGYFTTYNGVQRNYITRLNTNGSIDYSFNPGQGVGANGPVNSIAIQEDGKILISGSFTLYNNVPRSGIARLNINGSLDTSFKVGEGSNGTVFSTVVQKDNKILIGGCFTNYDNSSKSGLVRLNNDGTIDYTFDVGYGVNDCILNVKLQNDKVIIVGDFASYNGISRNKIARINSDGSIDTSFDPGSGANDLITTVALQNDNKIIIGGMFSSYDGYSINSVVKINNDGTLDSDYLYEVECFYGYPSSFVFSF